MEYHYLFFKQALPRSVPDDKVYAVLGQGRELLKRLAAAHPQMEFRHSVKDTTARLGGPLGQEVDVVYIQLACRFPKDRDFALPDQTRRLIAKYNSDKLSGLFAEEARKAQEERWAEIEKQAKESARHMDLRKLPGVETVPAHDVPLSKMLITDEELIRASEQPSGVSVFDGPMFPPSDKDVQ